MAAINPQMVLVVFPQNDAFSAIQGGVLQKLFRHIQDMLTCLMNCSLCIYEKKFDVCYQFLRHLPPLVLHDSIDNRILSCICCKNTVLRSVSNGLMQDRIFSVVYDSHYLRIMQKKGGYLPQPQSSRSSKSLKELCLLFCAF